MSLAPKDDVLIQLLNYLQLNEDQVGVNMVRQALVERAVLRSKLNATLSRLETKGAQLVATLERLANG